VRHRVHYIFDNEAENKIQSKILEIFGIGP